MNKSNSFFYLVSIFGMMTVKTRFLLIEIDQEQETKVASRGGKSFKPSPEKFGCVSKPEDKTLVEATATNYQTNVLTCAKDGADFCDGNHIQYTKGRDATHHFLRLDNVDAESCEPKPEKCHCITMLAQVLGNNPEATRIDGHFAAEPFMAGCQCFLGTAAIAGFKFLKVGRAKGRIEFNKENYVTTCTAIEKRNLSGDKMNAKIFKTDPNVKTPQ